MIYRQWIEFQLIHSHILTKTEIGSMRDRDVMRYYHQLRIVQEAEAEEQKKAARRRGK